MKSMAVSRRSARLVVALICAVLSACGERPPLDQPVAALEGPYRLDTKDQLRIIVYDQPNLTNIYEVSQSGSITMPLVGQVPARGDTTRQVADRITASLAKSYIRDPDVTVEVATYRPFFALGEVQNPGQYPYVPGMTAETAVAVAGGFTDRANMRVVRISRTLDGKLIEGRIAVTEPIRPGDTIYVSERLF
jgi:polysaccharide export outer membrane protein